MVFLLNKKEYGPYEGVCYYASSPIFSSDSESFAYTALEEKDGGWYLFLNEEKIGPYDIMYDLLFSPDSKNFAYVVQRGSEHFVVFNKQEGNSYETITDLAFSSDSRHIAYMARKNNNWFAVLDGEQQKKYDDKCYWNRTGPIFSPDSKSFAYCVKRDNNYFVVMDGKEKGPYDFISSIGFSADSKNFFYKATKGERSFVVLNGAEIGDRIERFVLSPNSKNFAYSFVAHNYMKNSTESFVVLSGEKGESYNHKGLIFSLTFSPDSKRLVYVVEEGFDYTCVANGEKGKTYLMINKITFSPNSEHLAYVAENRGEYKPFVVLDGKEMDLRYDYIFTDLVFTPDNKFLYYGALIGNELWWIVENVE
ncbi:MAG: hypothetical protein U9Q96_01135 [Patescibacteria group bacterium]|nr:hypothetical protein [Patescibacteria group bacterium]